MSVLRSAAKLAFAGADLFLRSPPGPRILIYHQVGAGLGRQMEVTTDDFVWQIDWLLANHDVIDLESALNSWEIAGAEELVALTFDDGYGSVYSTAFPRLSERGLPFTIYLATEMIANHNNKREARLTWAQLDEMLATGLVTIGAHTHGHRDLRTATHLDIIEEIGTSNSLIEQRLGIRPKHFAYPWGYWSETADPIVREEYTSAVLGAPVSARSQSFDPHMLYRFPIQRSDRKKWFVARLRGGLLLEEKMRRRIRGYQGP